MKSLDEMSLNDAIMLYYEKHDALLKGNMKQLIELKNTCPDIFDKEKDSQIREMIDYAKAFQTTDRYKELRRLCLKEKLTIVNNQKIDK